MRKTAVFASFRLSLRMRKGVFKEEVSESQKGVFKEEVSESHPLRR